MITAHLPAGFVLSHLADWRRYVLAAALLGSVFPDLDLLVFYLIDDRTVHHHRYWVHAPAFALSCSCVLWVLTPSRFKSLALAFGLAWLIHICLDTVVGDIMWLWPFSTEAYSFFTVPGVDGEHFLITMLTHWTILFEAAVWVAALTLFWTGRRDNG